MLRIPYCLDTLLTDGGKAVSLTHRQRSTPQKHYFSASGTHFCWRLSKPRGLERLEGLGKLKNFVHLIGARTRVLPACSMVPQPLRYRVPVPRESRACPSRHMFPKVYDKQRGISILRGLPQK
jgi:hypothetical protein